jgi:CheY-like chemotaxis protein
MNSSDCTILLVDDDADTVFLLRRAMQKANLNYPVQVAKDGQEAIDYLSHQGAYSDREQFPAPALMLLDLKMPRKNGFEVLEWVRQQPGLQRLIVVVLTSSNQATDVNRAYDLGSNSYLVKPAGFDAILAMLKTIKLYWLQLSERPDLLSPGPGPLSAPAPPDQHGET